MNSSLSTGNSSHGILPELRTYRHIELGSAIMLSILSPVTVISNALLLTAIYRDPLKCFRTPMTYFVAGLAVVDLLTGAIVEPLFAIYYYMDFTDLKTPPGGAYQLLHRIAGIISTVTITMSFFIVLALSVCQYIAVTYPHQFKEIISKNRVLGFLTVSCVYITTFCMLQFTGIDHSTYLKLHLIIHPTLISVILVIVQIMLFTSFNRHLQHSNTLRKKSSLNHSIQKRASYKKRLSERQFTVMTLYLTAILLASASLHIIVLYIHLFKEPESDVENINIHIGLRISDLMLFIKVAVDIFIYAWRLPSYRRALRCTFFGNAAVARSSTYRKSSEYATAGQENGRRGPGTESATL